MTNAPTENLTHADGSPLRVLVVDDEQMLADLLASQRIAVETPERGVLTLTAAPAARIGELAAAHGIVLHELTTIKASLEDAYLELTGGNTEYNTSIPRGQADQPVTQQHALR